MVHTASPHCQLHTLRGVCLFVYRSDDEVSVLQTNISMGDLWLEGMAVGAASSNRTVQYCMPFANQILCVKQFASETPHSLS